jgi:predicted helicase
MTPATNIILKLNSWSEFEGSLCTLSRKEKGDAFEELTRLHLLSDPIFTTKLQHVWHHTDIPQRVIDELGLMQPEIGVDLVAQTRDGDYWAIQCKFHQDPTVNVGYGELKSFFGITERRQTYGRLSHRLICTSANGVSDNVTKAHPDKLGYLTSAEFSALGPEQFSAFHSLIEGERPTLVAYSPMSHQKTAIAKARDHFIAGRNSRGKLIHPCGTGKSLTGYWIAETLGARQVLIAVPSLFLVRQTLSVWAREAVASGHDMEWLAVCSDEDVSKSDDPAMRRSELGIDVTTDTKIVSAFLKKPSATTKVVITTYQSGHVTSAGANAANAKFDLGIFDEAHKTVGAADTLFSHLLSDKNVSVDRRIFMTATERQYRGNSDDVLSMDDREMYGDTFDLLSFKAALELDPPILCDYRIVSIVVTKSEIEQLIANQTMIRSDGKEWSLEGDARMLAAMIALRKTIKKHGIHHCISFHRSIERSKQFAHLNTEATKADQELDRLSCFHVSGKDKTGKRKQELDRFVDASPSLITNARCLTEGVDVPAIDAILFADPRQSKIDIVQAAGRAMRKFKGKELGYILVPVTIDEELDDPSDAAFEQIINVLSALATQDERIVEEFTTMATSNWAHKSSLIEVDIPDYVRVNFSDFLRDVEIRIWDRLGRGWPRGFERLQAYVDREGHARVLLNYKDETGFKLGSWVATRRTEYNRGDLTSDRIEALDALPGWVWDPLARIIHAAPRNCR